MTWTSGLPVLAKSFYTGLTLVLPFLGSALRALFATGLMVLLLTWFKEWASEKNRRREVLSRLRQETKANKEVLLSVIRPRGTFPCTQHVLTFVVSRGMTDIPESDELYNAVANGIRLYQALDAQWNMCAQLAAERPADSPEVRWADRYFGFLLADYCTPMLDLGIRLVTLELRRLSWGKPEGRARIRQEQMDIERCWKETAEREGFPFDLEQYELTMRRLTEQLPSRLPGWRRWLEKVQSKNTA